jgi:carbon storage regulator CsrA
MLVVTRKSQESVVVGGYDRFERLLKVTVLEIGNGRVRLGFEADVEVPVHRLELWEQITACARPDNPTAGPGDQACDHPPE